jgi:cytochrome c peroxidase
MRAFNEVRSLTGWVLALLGCACSASSPQDDGRTTGEASEVAALGLSSAERLESCGDDPRVIAGLVSADVCAGADIFFRETFEGNGRTCASCHPVANNTTIDVPFVTALRAASPSDPLFVFERDPNLTNLETTDLVRFAAILENVDGFEDPVNKFVSRVVPHVLSLATSVTRDPAEARPSPPVERVGWGGDGPGDGSLREFLAAAVTQHFPKNLARRPGIDFRLPTPEEAEFARAFQLSLGRTNELDLAQVRMSDADAERGRQAFLDPLRGRCHACHANAGANFLDTGRNRNFDTGVRFTSGGLKSGRFNGKALVDGGFGGVGLASPNLDGNGSGFPNAFGDGSFNVPPLIEAADTGPFFHNNFHPRTDIPQNLEQAVAFYASFQFSRSPAAAELERKFGSRLNLLPLDAAAIARFLRALNAAFNLDIAKQRLDAANVLATRFADTRADVQRRLMELAAVEIDDALAVLLATLFPNARAPLALAKSEIASGVSAASAADRGARITSALAAVATARAMFGTNIEFRLGQGNLMF